MITCKACGHEQDATADRCERCNAELLIAFTSNAIDPAEADDFEPPVSALNASAALDDIPALESQQENDFDLDAAAPDIANTPSNGRDDEIEQAEQTDVVSTIAGFNFIESLFGEDETAPTPKMILSGDFIVNTASGGIPCAWSRCGRVRAVEETFICAECQKSFCLHHRDRARPSLCRSCTRPREVTIKISIDDPDTDAATLQLESIGLRDDVWEYKHACNLGDLRALFGIDLADAEVSLDPADIGDALGNALFSHCFPDEPWSEIVDDVRAWVDRRHGVQFRFVDLPASMRTWPWELLQGPDGFVARSQSTSVVRWVESNGLAYPSQSTLPLTMLVVAGDARSPGDLARAEADALSAALAEQIEEGRIAVEPFVPGDHPLDELRHKLRSDRYQILHICGHLTVATIADRAGTTLDGMGEPIALGQLTDWFSRSTIQVVVLAATLLHNGNPVSAINAALSLPEQLLTNSVGALFTTRSPLDLQTARELTRVFYESLAQEHPLESALLDAREHLQTADTRANMRAWSLPVLYLRTIDGEGLVLDLDPAEALPEQPKAYQRFVAEEDEVVNAAELPSCAPEALQRLKQHRLQVIVGTPDAGLLALARFIAGQLTQEQPTLKVLRLPRYEDPGDLLRLLPDLQGAAVLYDAHRLGPIGEELDRLARIVALQTNIFVILSTSDESARDARSPAGAWLRQHADYCTLLRPEDYKDNNFASLHALLKRLLGDARKSGLIDLKTEQEVLKYADATPDDLFNRGYLQLPGQVNRFVFHYLAGSKRVASREKIRLLLDAMDNADDEVLRWFGDALALNQRVLVSCFILFQGLPIHVLASLYRLIVDRLRAAFHLDLAVLPMRAEVQQWRLYLSEARHPQHSSDDRIVEFVDQEHRNELLRQLRENYGEWMTELVPLLGSIICGTADLQDKRRNWSEEEERWIREAIARALGDIAGSSPRSLNLVADQMLRCMTTPWSHVRIDQGRSPLQVSAARQIMAMPGNTFQQLLEQGGGPREYRQLIEIMAAWWRIDHPQVRWAVAAAFSRLAGYIPATRLEPHYRAMIRETQEVRQGILGQVRQLQFTQRSRQAGKIRKQEIDPRLIDQQLRTAQHHLRDATEISRAMAHALRGFAGGRNLAPLRTVVQLLAEDGDVRVRINTAVAISRHASGQPAVVTGLIEEWCMEGNRQRWWTGICAATLMIEQGRIDEAEAERLWLSLIHGARVVAARTRDTASLKDAANLLAWAMGAAAEAAEGQTAGSGLDRSLALIGRLIGDDPRRDDLLSAVCQAIIAEERRAGEIRSRALLARAREWLAVKQYVTQRVRRRVALFLFLMAGESQQRETYEILRDLLRQEAFNYNGLLGRTIDTLPLAHLGVGGMILLAAKELVDTATAEGLSIILATLRQLTMINEPHVWSVGPFVLCGLADTTNSSRILKELQLWSRGPQVPLQFGSIETAIQLARQNPTVYLDQACQVLLMVARNPRHARVVDRLNERIPEIIDLHNATGREIIGLLDAAGG